MQIKDGQVRRERRKEVTCMTYTQVESRLTCVDGARMRRFAGECPANGVPVGGGGL